MLKALKFALNVRVAGFPYPVLGQMSGDKYLTEGSAENPSPGSPDAPRILSGQLGQ